MSEFAPLLDLELTRPDEFLLRVGDEVRSGSLFYFEIDRDEEDTEWHPRDALARLLNDWLTHLIDSDHNARCFLPFDFADECTQWLACEKSGDEVHVVLGWAPVEGWAISPLGFRSAAESLEGFTPDEPLRVQTFYVPRFLSDLRRLIGRLRDCQRPEALTEEPPSTA